MTRRTINHHQPQQQADRPTLWLLCVLIVAVFMALTFGEADGAGQKTEQNAVFPMSSL